MVIVQCVVNGFALAPEPHELGILEHPQLMEDYVKNIVSATGSDAEQYTIEWIYLDK